MGKDKDKPKLGIKTSRYYTKTCICNFEYPSWFTNCPKCGAIWNETDEKIDSIEKEEFKKKKNIKIVVKITEEDFDEAIGYVQLIFSVDQGKSWFQMKMDNNMDYFIAEIAEVPIGAVVIYYIEVYLVNGEKVIENNDGNYFKYQVGNLNLKVKGKNKGSELKVSNNNIND